MANSRDKKSKPAKTKELKRINRTVPVLRVKKGASLKEIYAAARGAFTAADLQKYTELEEGIPAEQILTELEAFDREQKRKRYHPMH